jgi:enoyl-CoA hydratase/carnithine racemase
MTPAALRDIRANKGEGMEQRIRVTMKDGVADVRLSRPDKMNALDQAMFDALVETGSSLARQPGLRAVVISGEGRAFCAGLDMGRFAQMAGPAEGRNSASTELRLGTRSHGIANAAQYAVLVWQDIPVPVIAAVHGVAFGGGFQLALGADMRFVAADTKMSIMEIKWGLVPDMGGMLLMPRLARGDVIRELTYSGRVFSGTEALTLGFATRICADPYAEALAYAREVAGRSPHAVRANKRLMKVMEAGDAAAILRAESDEQVRLIGSANQKEAVQANLQRRAPIFAETGPES